MRAVPALYQDGRVFFHFDYPEYEGPVSVLVIFPGDELDEPASMDDDGGPLRSAAYGAPDFP